MCPKRFLVLILLLSLVYAEWSEISIHDPYGWEMVDHAEMSTTDPSPCGSHTEQNAASSCTYTYDYGPPDSGCGEQGDWMGYVWTYTLKCRDGGCDGSWVSASGCTGCGGSETCCMLTEYSGGTTLYNINYDNDQGDCECGGYTWMGSFCCGDDGSETVEARDCVSGCTSNPNDKACCDATSDCVSASTCYNSGTSTEDVDGNGDDEYCNSGSWYDCYDTGDCLSDPVGITVDGEACVSGECSPGSCTGNLCVYCRDNGYGDCDTDAGCCSGRCFFDDDRYTDPGACDVLGDPLCNDDEGNTDMCLSSTQCGYDPGCDSASVTAYVEGGSTSADMDCDGDNDYCNSGIWYDCYDDDQCPSKYYCSSNDCVQLQSPTLLTNTSTCSEGDSCSEEARVQLSWNHVTGAESYRIHIYNGHHYETHDIGYVTSWDSDSANWWPTNGEIDTWASGSCSGDVYKSGGTGSDLPEDPNYMYYQAAQGCSGPYETSHFRYWVHVSSARSSGKNSGTPWNGATWTGFDPVPDSGNCACRDRGDSCEYSYTTYSADRLCNTSYCGAQHGGEGVCCDSGTCCDDDGDCGALEYCDDGDDAVKVFMCEAATELARGTISGFYGTSTYQDVGFYTNLASTSGACIMYDVFDAEDGSQFDIIVEGTKVADAEGGGNNVWMTYRYYDVSSESTVGNTLWKLEATTCCHNYDNLLFGWLVSEAGATDGSSSTSCCDNSTDCVDDYVKNSTWGCYDAGTFHDTGGGDEEDDEECRSGTWYAQDQDETACENAGNEYFGTKCCGDDPGELASTPLDGTCTEQPGNPMCCFDNKCGYNFGGGNYSCVAVGTACGNYLCSESVWWPCETTAGAYCNRADLDNDGYYDRFCDNSTGEWENTADMTDMCETACEQMNGMWTGQDIYPSDTKNCCSSADSSTWCLSTATRTIRCSSGKPTDCGAYCDSNAIIVDDGKNYDCTAANDRDCTTRGCSGTSCDCAKGEGTGCYLASACESDGCLSYTVAAGETTYFDPPSSPADTQNGGSFSGVCCPSDSCPYDNDGDGSIDSCSVNGTVNSDSDNDGDQDYCLEGTWSECQEYSCTTADGCYCMGNATNTGDCYFYTEEPGQYSTGTGACHINNDTLECATPCDSDGNTTTREYVNAQGFCVRGGGSCQDVYESVEWFGNASLSFVNVSVDCLCASQASCTVDVYNSSGLVTYTTSKTVPASGGYDLIALDEPFDIGSNRVELNCSCGASGTTLPVSCNRTIATLDYEASSSFTAPLFKVGATNYLTVLVNNIGDVNLASFTLGVSVTNGGVTLTNISSQADLAKGGSRIIAVPLDVPINMFKDTKETQSNQTTVLIHTNVTDVLLMHDVNSTTSCYQCDGNSDCPTACPSPADNCWAYGGLSNFSCSLGVCCPSSQHFEDGACCPLGYRCCVTDSTCSEEEWCANSSGYTDYGIVWSCNDFRLNGQTCGEDRMCSSANCEAAPQGSNNYCCSPVLTVPEAAGECKTLQGGDVCSSSGCCTSDAECSSADWCSLLGYRCLDCPDDTSEGYFNSYCVSSKCVGTDADCCTVDAECSTASDIAGATYFCNGETYTCEPCTRSLDYYCPSMLCHEDGPDAGDPDCCNGDSDCVSGNKCVDNTCVPENVGKYCSSDDQCGESMSCIGNGCVLDDFLIITPTTVDMNVGEVRYASVVVRDPQLRQDTYTVSLAGKYLQFAQLESSNALTITLGPNEVKKFTMTLYGGAAISGANIKVFASSQNTPGVSSEKEITLNIAQTGGSGVVSAAPGLDIREAVAVLIIGGALVWSLKKL